MSDANKFVLEREFDAPRAQVWRAWTDAALLHQWYGPGVETIIHKLDVTPGGEWRNEMKMGERSDLSIATYQEVVQEEKLVWHHSSADADWNVTQNAMMPTWPRVLLTVVTFEELGDKTRVTLTWEPIDASPEEQASFAQMKSQFGKGWEMGYKIMDDILAKMG